MVLSTQTPLETAMPISVKLAAITLDDLVHSTDPVIKEHALAIMKEYQDYDFTGCPDPKRDDELQSPAV